MTRKPADRLRTPLCDLLGIDLPIVQAPMGGGPTTPALVAAVCEAGALGNLAAARLSTEQLREQIREVRARTSRPFGVNWLLAPPEPGNRDVAAAQRALDPLREELGLPPGPTEIQIPPSVLGSQLELAVEERVPVMSCAMGHPAPILEAARSGSAIVMAMVTTVEEARAVADAGAAVVVAQGAEAGGHRSTFPLAPDQEPALVGTMALVPQVVDAVAVPVIAAGGIADGRGVAAALALGASGAQLGSRFLVAHEGGAHPGWKEALARSSAADTVVTRAFTGRPARGLRNRLVDHLAELGIPPLAWPLQSLAALDLYAAEAEFDRVDRFPALGGQTGPLLRLEQPAAEIVSELARDATAILERLGRV